MAPYRHTLSANATLTPVPNFEDWGQLTDLI